MTDLESQKQTISDTSLFDRGQIYRTSSNSDSSPGYVNNFDFSFDAYDNRLLEDPSSSIGVRVENESAIVCGA